MGNRYLYLVRHAQRAVETADDGPLEQDLTPAGVEQARLTGLRFAPLPIDTIYTSPLLRATRTADAIAAHHPSARRITLPELIESAPGLPRDFTADYGTVTAAEVAEMRRVADLAFARLFAPSPDRDTFDVAVSHGNIIRYLLVRAMGLPLDLWRRFDVMNCSICVVNIAPTFTCVERVGDVGHLPRELQSFVRDAAPHAV